RERDAALFSDEDVVGAAGGLGVHHLEADARLAERRGEPRMREALVAARAEQHDLDAERCELGEILHGEMREVGCAPCAHFGGGDDDVVIATLAVHRDVIVAVARDGVGAARDGGVKFHATILAMREFSRIKRLPPYVFNITNELKMAARRSGEDVIDLSMGNPDGPTPQHIVDKLVEASRRPDTHGYSVSRGIPRLRKAICDWYKRRYAIDLDIEKEAIVTI